MRLSFEQASPCICGDVTSSHQVDVEMDAILGRLSLGYTLKEEAGPCPLGIYDRRGIPSQVAEVVRFEELVPAIEARRWVLKFVAQSFGPEPGQASGSAASRVIWIDGAGILSPFEFLLHLRPSTFNLPPSTCPYIMKTAEPLISSAFSLCSASFTFSRGKASTCDTIGISTASASSSRPSCLVLAVTERRFRS